MKTKIAIVALAVSLIMISCVPARNKAIPTVGIVSPVPFAAATVTPTDLPTNIILDVALSADGSKLAVYTNRVVYLYDMETLRKTVFKEFKNPDYEVEINKLRFSAGAVALSPNGKMIALSGKSVDTAVNLWDVSTHQLIMSINEIPAAYLVTKIQFSPDGSAIFIRSNYGWSVRCEQSDANFALHTLEFSNVPQAQKIFDTDICQTIPMGFVRFADRDKFLLFIQFMGPNYQVSTVEIAPTAVVQEREYESLHALYDVSPNGKIYAFLSSKANLRVTKLVDAETSKVLETLPYKVKLLDTKDRFLVRDFFSSDGEWKLWENDCISCEFGGLTNSDLDWELSANGQIFATISSDNNVMIWNVSDCSVKTMLYLDK